MMMMMTSACATPLNRQQPHGHPSEAGSRRPTRPSCPLLKEIIVTQSPTTNALTQLAAECVWLWLHNLSRRRLQSGQTGHHLEADRLRDRPRGHHEPGTHVPARTMRTL